MSTTAKISELLPGEQFRYCGDIYQLQQIGRKDRLPWPSPIRYAVGPPDTSGVECYLPPDQEVKPLGISGTVRYPHPLF
jgi:hypothetical protein